MALAIVQHKSQINGSAVPGTFTITSTPTVGNYIIASVGVNIATASLTVNTSAWTILKRGRNELDDTDYQLLLIRKVQIGDTSTLPAFCTAGTTYSSYCIWEVSGCSGVIKDDVLGVYFDSKHNAQTSFVTAAMVGPINGALALIALTRYNGSSNSSMSAGGWTQDEAQNNAGNYGSVSGHHHTYNDGDAISGTASIPTANNPGSWAMVLLGDGTQPTRPFIRQLSRGYTASAAFTPTGTLNLGADPRDGNLILAFAHRERGNVATPTWSGNYTDLTHADGATGAEVACRYFYASSTSGTALPALITSGSNAFSAFFFMEVGPVSGTIGTDVVFADSARQATGTTLTTTSRNTNANNELAIVVAHNYNDGTFPVLSGTWNDIGHFDDSTNYGAVQLSQAEYPTSGTAVTTTITYNRSTDPSGWVQLIIKSTGSLVNYSLTVDQVSYTYTAESVSFGFDHPLHLDAASYSYTPQNVNLNQGRFISVDQASYSYTAENVDFHWTHILALTNASYQVLPQDFLLTPSFHRHFSFSEFRRTDFQDWGAESYESFFNTCQSLDSPDLKTQTPWIYTFTKTGDDVGAFMEVQWDWHDSGVRVFGPQQVYVTPPNAHYLLSTSKVKVRGKGRQVHVKYSNDGDKDFNILGWVVFYDTQAGQ